MVKLEQDVVPSLLPVRLGAPLQAGGLPRGPDHVQRRLHGVHDALLQDEGLDSEDERSVRAAVRGPPHGSVLP